MAKEAHNEASKHNDERASGIDFYSAAVMRGTLRHIARRIGTGLVYRLWDKMLLPLVLYLIERKPGIMLEPVRHLFECEPLIVLEAIGPLLNRGPNLDNMPFDLPVESNLRFEHLAGLFTSTSLDHSVISMPVRQTAYLFGMVRQMKARKVIEIGRYKGGSTLTVAAAMKEVGGGHFWSVDIGDKEARLHEGKLARPFDEQVMDVCKRFGLNVTLIVGDSRTIEFQSGEVDLVFIDGDHSYEGVKNDFERFGKRVRVGGAVLFDDAFDEGSFKTHSDTVGRLVQEVVAEGEFKLVNVVNRLAHLERVRPR